MGANIHNVGGSLGFGDNQKPWVAESRELGDGRPGCAPLVRTELCIWFLLSVSVPQWEFPKCSGAKAEPCLSAVLCVSGPV